jgi:hypothetical protein
MAVLIDAFIAVALYVSSFRHRIGCESVRDEQAAPASRETLLSLHNPCVSDDAHDLTVGQQAN